tara:strand:- start:126 stop:398 length:273 start_codon:yes stop_codon:yes gene_type:complete
MSDIGSARSTEIRKGVPMPRAQSSRTLDLPFENMDVGDSFEIEVDTDYETSTKHMENRVRSAAYRNGKRLDLSFAVRRIDDYTLGVWRTR